MVIVNNANLTLIIVNNANKYEVFFFKLLNNFVRYTSYLAIYRQDAKHLRRSKPDHVPQITLNPVFAGNGQMGPGQIIVDSVTVPGNAVEYARPFQRLESLSPIQLLTSIRKLLTIISNQLPFASYSVQEIVYFPFHLLFSVGGGERAAINNYQ